MLEQHRRTGKFTCGDCHAIVYCEGLAFYCDCAYHAVYMEFCKLSWLGVVGRQHACSCLSSK